MSDHDLLIRALSGLPSKPADTASRADKRRYSELMSEAVAQALAATLRGRGLDSTRPSPPGEVGASGAERRIAGGIGDKKVDVTWATEEAGLLLGLSVKCINFRDGRTKNFQKNFTNRRGDMLMEAVTLHRRFPYSVLFGLVIFDHGAAEDDTERRRSTVINAHRGLRMFTGRSDPAGRDEQYELLYIALVDATPFKSEITFAPAGEPDLQLRLDDILEPAVDLLAERNPDGYEVISGSLRRVRRGS